jgi:CheY-like chemotaxis protein
VLELPHRRLLELPDDPEAGGPLADFGWDGPARRRTATPVKVLFIDDNEALTELARAILGRLGREVHTAATGAEGRDRLQRIHPDVVICDINLPDGLGYEVLAAMRREADSNPPFIFMSGGPDIDTERCRRLGAVAIVAKPCPFAELDQLIDQLHVVPGAKQTAA